MKSQDEKIKPGSLEGICLKCGTGLEIIESGRRTGIGFSSFTADKYILNPSEKAPKSE